MGISQNSLSLALSFVCSIILRTPRVFPIPKAHKFAKGLWASPSIGLNKAKLIACLYFRTRLTLFAQLDYTKIIILSVHLKNGAKTSYIKKKSNYPYSPQKVHFGSLIFAGYRNFPTRKRPRRAT